MVGKHLFVFLGSPPKNPGTIREILFMFFFFGGFLLPSGWKSSISSRPLMSENARFNLGHAPIEMQVKNTSVFRDS